MPRFRIPRLRRRPRAPAPPPPPPPAPPPPPPPAVPPPPAAEPAPPPPVEREPRGTRVRALGHALAGGAAAVGRVPSAAASGLRRFWLSLSLRSRRRLALALGVLAVLLVIGFVAVPALPCEAPGGDVCPPSDDAIALVPDDALAYLHVNVDPGTDQYGKASDVASRVPTLTDQLTSRLLRRVPGPHGHTLDFAQDIQPWFGGQAALAVIPAGERAGEEVQLLQISDTDGAKEFAASIATGTPQTSDYRDVPVTVDRRGLATADVGGFLAVGRESGVRDAIDAQSGASGTGSLEEEPAADAALDALPDERLADAYLSPDGIDRLVGNPRGPLATLDAVIDPGASAGAAMALMASDSGIELDIRSELDEARAKAQPGFFAAFPSFDPSLTTSLPSDSLAYVGMAEPGKTLVSLIEQASADQPGLAAAVDSLVKRVKQLGKVDLEKDLLPALGDEAAFALQPGGGPYLEFLSSGIDAERAGKALASLQAPIVKALRPAPAFVEHNVGGVTAHSVKVSPTVDLTYAIAGSVLLVATDPAAVKQLTSEAGGLGDDDVFKEATSGLTSDVSVLGFLNLFGLLTLAEQAGLAEDPAYTTFAPELHKLSALGVSVRESSTELATDVRLIVTPQAPPSQPSSSEGKGKGSQD